MRKAGSEMPMAVRIFSPARPKSVSRMAAIRVARQPIRRLCASLMPWVSAMNSGARPIGSMTTNSVTKAVRIAAMSIVPLMAQPDGAAKPDRE